jgi:hypothetical protein
MKIIESDGLKIYEYKQVKPESFFSGSVNLIQTNGLKKVDVPKIY